MTPHELLLKLINQRGDCLRWCSYCPEDYKTAEVKECIENMIKEIYLLRQDKDELLKDIIKLQSAYRKATGKNYTGDDDI